MVKQRGVKAMNYVSSKLLACLYMCVSARCLCIYDMMVLSAVMLGAQCCCGVYRVYRPPASSKSIATIYKNNGQLDFGWTTARRGASEEVRASIEDIERSETSYAPPSRAERNHKYIRSVIHLHIYTIII